MQHVTFKHDLSRGKVKGELPDPTWDLIEVAPPAPPPKLEEAGGKEEPQRSQNFWQGHVKVEASWGDLMSPLPYSFFWFHLFYFQIVGGTENGSRQPIFTCRPQFSSRTPRSWEGS